MGASAIPPASPTSVPKRPAPEPDLRAVATALKAQKEHGEALVRLVEQSIGAGDKGRHVDYYA
jgi:hypothetical protein